MNAMSLNARQQQILDRVQARGELKISELKQLFDVTEMTIRRDLEKLEQQGSVRRTFGGVVWIGKDVALQERSVIRMEEKARIGAQAAKLILPGQSIFMDGGTTTLQIARSIEPNLEVTVVTNALNVAQELQHKGISVIVVGGWLRKSTSSMVGSMAMEMISRMAFDRTFLGASGLTGEHGFSNTNMEEAELKRLAVKQSKETYVVMDHSKFGSRSLFSFANLDQVNHLITSRLPSGDLLESCRQAGIQLILAEPDGRQ